MNEKILTVTLNAALDKTYSFDHFAVNSVHRPQKITALPGGKGLNVARVLHTLDVNVLATGFVGGYIGKCIVQELNKQGLPNDFQEVKEESRLCINILDEKSGTSTEILEDGAHISPEEVQGFLEKFKILSQEAKVVVMSGSIPLGVSINIYRELIEIAKENKAITILDTSGAGFTEGVKAKPFMVKPNKAELEKACNTVLPTINDIKSVMQNIMNEGISLFALSMGEKGSLVGYKGEFYVAYPPRIKAVNPVGCGDAYVAGFALGLVKGMYIEDVIKLATAVAASNALHHGAGIVEKSEVEKLLKDVEIGRLN